MSDMLEAVLFLTSITFIIAVGGAVIQGIAFYRRYRIRLQISSKTPSIHSRELMSMAPDTIPLLSNPAPLAHSRQDTVLGSQRWPDYHGDRRRSSFMSRPMPPGGTSINLHPNLNPPHLFQPDQSAATADGPASASPNTPRVFPYSTTFGATVHPEYSSVNAINSSRVDGMNHPFERLATPDTISHMPSHTT